MARMTIRAHDSNENNLFDWFEGSFRNECLRNGFEILEYHCNRDFSNPKISFEIYNKDKDLYYNKKEVYLQRSLEETKIFGIVIGKSVKYLQLNIEIKS